MHHGTCLRLPHLKLSLSIEGMAISSNPTLKSKAAEFACLGMPELAGKAQCSETKQGALKNRETFHSLSEHFEVAFRMTWRVIANPEHCSAVWQLAEWVSETWKFSALHGVFSPNLSLLLRFFMRKNPALGMDPWLKHVAAYIFLWWQNDPATVSKRWKNAIYIMQSRV